MAMSKEVIDWLIAQGVPFDEELDKKQQEYLKEELKDWEIALYERWGSDSAPISE